VGGGQTVLVRRQKDAEFVEVATCSPESALDHALSEAMVWRYGLNGNSGSQGKIPVMIA
jgi:hypothetical protein